MNLRLFKLFRPSMDLGDKKVLVKRARFKKEENGNFQGNRGELLVGSNKAKDQFIHNILGMGLFLFRW